MTERGPKQGARASLRYPDFLGIGAQKAGTTWLLSALGRHPDLWIPPIKELHYFDAVHLGRVRDPEPAALQSGRIERAAAATARLKARSNMKPARREERLEVLKLLEHREITDEWYGKIFRAAPDHAKCGEKTPEYALLPDAGFEHMMRLNPAMKFLFILRDPIDRAWSQLRMIQRNSAAPSVHVPEVLRFVDKTQFIARSDYMPTIARVRRSVPESRLLILFFDDLVADPAAFLKAVMTFLDVDPTRGRFANVNDARNVGGTEALTPELYERLKELLRPAYRRLQGLESPIIADWITRHYGAEP